MPADLCANCGAEIPRDARACPECGADEKTGWSEEAKTAGLDLPEEDFDYEEFVKREFSEKKSPIPRGIHWFWWLVAVIIAVILVWTFLL